jgi:uncharacterized protein DUF4062
VEHRVFVSSRGGELKSFRRAAINAIRALGMVPVAWELLDPDSRSPRRSLLSHVRKCDALVLLVGGTYGQPGRSGVDPTEEEFRQARACGIPVLAFECTDLHDAKTRTFLDTVRGSWEAGLLTTRVTSEGHLAEQLVRCLVSEFVRRPTTLDADHYLVGAARRRYLELMREDRWREALTALDGLFGLPTEHRRRDLLNAGVLALNLGGYETAWKLFSRVAGLEEPREWARQFALPEDHEEAESLELAAREYMVWIAHYRGDFGYAVTMSAQLLDRALRSGSAHVPGIEHRFGRALVDLGAAAGSRALVYRGALHSLAAYRRSPHPNAFLPMAVFRSYAAIDHPEAKTWLSTTLEYAEVRTSTLDGHLSLLYADLARARGDQEQAGVFAQAALDNFVGFDYQRGAHEAASRLYQAQDAVGSRGDAIVTAILCQRIADRLSLPTRRLWETRLLAVKEVVTARKFERRAEEAADRYPMIQRGVSLTLPGGQILAEPWHVDPRPDG